MRCLMYGLCLLVMVLATIALNSYLYRDTAPTIEAMRSSIPKSGIYRISSTLRVEMAKDRGAMGSGHKDYETAWIPDGLYESHGDVCISHDAEHGKSRFQFSGTLHRWPNTTPGGLQTFPIPYTAVFSRTDMQTMVGRIPSHLYRTSSDVAVAQCGILWRGAIDDSLLMTNEHVVTVNERRVWSIHGRRARSVLLSTDVRHYGKTTWERWFVDPETSELVGMECPISTLTHKNAMDVELVRRVVFKPPGTDQQ
jgi:hypothetical protein